MTDLSYEKNIFNFKLLVNYCTESRKCLKNMIRKQLQIMVNLALSTVNVLANERTARGGGDKRW